MSLEIGVAVHGACGRMGEAVERALASAPDCSLVYRSDPLLQPDSGPPRSAIDLSGLVPGEVAGIIDFSLPEATGLAIDAARRLRCALVSGTTGLDQSTREAMREASREIPICWAPNFSTGVPILVHALRETAARLPAPWQIEIVEAHHKAKRDAPSGTALRLAETWREVQGGRFVHGREGKVGPREHEEIGLHAVRLGDVIGEHRVLLGGVGETVELTHRVQDRAAFASGSVEALRRLLDRQPGLYEWDDLLCGD